MMETKNSIIVAGIFVLGFLLGRFGAVPHIVAQSHLELWALYLLIFTVGIGVGSNTEALKVVKRMHTKIVLVPVAVVAGTLFGSGLASFLLPGISLRQGLAVGGGFGYYSLSSVIAFSCRTVCGALRPARSYRSRRSDGNGYCTSGDSKGLWQELCCCCRIQRDGVDGTRTVYRAAAVETVTALLRFVRIFILEMFTVCSAISRDFLPFSCRKGCKFFTTAVS